MSVRRGVVVALVLLTGLAACGGNGGDQLSAATRDRLEQLTRQVRVAAASRDRARTRLALAAVRREVARGEQSGDIGAARADRLLADVAAVQAKLALVPVATTTTVTAAPTEPEPPKGPGKGKGPKGPGKDKGPKGKGPGKP